MITKHLLLFFVCALISVPTIVSAAGDQPEVGTVAPDFQLTTNEANPASLKYYRGKWLVLYFYPKDFTTGCTLEAPNFQRDLATYAQPNPVILRFKVYA